MTWCLHVLVACMGPQTSPDTATTDTEDTGPANPDTADADNDGWSRLQGDCADDDRARHPGASESVGDGIDSDCDGGDGTSLPVDGLVRALPSQPNLSFLEFGLRLRTADVDDEPGDEVLVATQAPYEGAAALLSGATLEERASWRGPHPGSELGHSVAIHPTTSHGVQLVFHDTGGLWASGTDDPGGVPRSPPWARLSDSAEWNTGNYIGSFQLIGDEDNDMIVECGNSALWDNDDGAVCVLDGAITGDRMLADAELKITGADGLGSGFSGSDFDGDGKVDLAVGASDHNRDAGLIAIFLGQLIPGALRVEYDAQVRWEGEAAGDWLGHEVAHGDLDGDGAVEVIAVAMGWPKGTRRGRVYGLPVEASLSKPAYTIDGDPGWQHLGADLAVGDFNGDGADDLALGSPGWPSLRDNPGRVLVFFGPLSGSIQASDADVAYRGEALGDNFGRGVAAADVNGDGVTDLLVGATYHDSAGINAGAVYLIPGPLAR